MKFLKSGNESVSCIDARQQDNAAQGRFFVPENLCRLLYAAGSKTTGKETLYPPRFDAVYKPARPAVKALMQSAAQQALFLYKNF